MLWLLLTTLRHFAINVHSIAAMCSAIMFTFAETQHTLNIHIFMLIFHTTCAIIQVTPSIMLAVQQTIQLMMPPKTRGYKTFAHPKLRCSRYWRRIRYKQRRHRSQTLYRLFMLLLCVLAKLYRFQLWKGLGTGSPTKPIRHTPHPDKIFPRANRNIDYKQEVHRQAKYQESSKQGCSAPNEAADSAQYGGGKGSRLNALWDKLK